MDSYYNHGILQGLTPKKFKQTKLVVKPKKKRKPITDAKRVDNQIIGAYIKSNIYAGKDRKGAIASAYKSLKADKRKAKKRKADAELERTQPKIDLFFSKNVSKTKKQK